MADGQRLLLKITRETLPQVKDRYPFLYLERGRLEVDDSSVKWIDATGQVLPLPVATLNCLMLGPGTSVTHEAVKTTVAANCSLSWVGEDCLLFYAAGHLPTADSRNLKQQIALASNPADSLEVARAMYATRFPDADLQGKTLKEMMGMEGYRVKQLYQAKAEEYKVGWAGRNFTPGNFQLSDVTNQILTATNAALYGILCAVVHSMGYSPHIGFIHSGSPLPFIYDMADLYKEHLCIDLAFQQTSDLAGRYDRAKVSAAFRERAVEMDLLAVVSRDITTLLWLDNARRRRK
ncbi:type I-E CRISPR-associated endonuclease Cas1e [Insolitispirillum peregrinum]|uniref:CRISPR-associated endonuclease Cas1 n=1 Tax=Insolitispirillum peregrinum TaxID=80876 RepID=A0A1N7MFX8_9PROT|nr:type I-E CRISPR-associated endonuclease Cas1e [Insolitispirillum peregrinum]SIS84891.1 CRISPR-associated protein, Cas1 family [Insolitispirillum peregrinum]